eukprot:scaffold87676_cov26-Tisochrysis_lutea.AAC.2
MTSSHWLGSLREQRREKRRRSGLSQSGTPRSGRSWACVRARGGGRAPSNGQVALRLDRAAHLA